MKTIPIPSIALISLICVVVVVQSLGAQSLFQVYDTTIANFESYRYPEECFGATSRTSRERISEGDSVWTDTAAFDINTFHRASDPKVIDVAKRCLSSIGANISTQLSSPAHGYMMVDLLLKIGEDSLARDLSEKLIATIKGPDTLDILIALMKVYTGAVPARLDDIDRIHNIMLTRLSTGREFDMAILASGWVLGTYWSRDLDRSIFLKTLKKMEGFVDTLPSNLRSRRSFYGLASQMLTYIGVVSKDEIRDSLLKSTEAYKNFLTSKWNKITGGNLPGPFAAFAEIIPEPKGEVVYSKKPDGEVAITTESAFSKGGVNITVFLHDGCHSETPRVFYGRGGQSGKNADCWKTVAGLRRLKGRFPEISVTVVAKTWGNFASSPPVDQDKEAETIAKYFLGFHGLDVKVVIAHPEFFRLPGYDNRKIDMNTQVEEDFVINEKQLNSTTSVIITDQNNKIFHIGSIVADLEDIVAFRIRAVLDRRS